MFYTTDISAQNPVHPEPGGLSASCPLPQHKLRQALTHSSLHGGLTVGDGQEQAPLAEEGLKGQGLFTGTLWSQLSMLSVISIFKVVSAIKPRKK